MKAVLDLALRTLVIAKIPNNAIYADDCLAKSYHGTYGVQSVFIPRDDCFLTKFHEMTDTKAVFAVLPEKANELVWIQRMAVDSNIADSHQLEWESGKHWDDMDNALKDEISRLQSINSGGAPDIDEVDQYSFTLDDDEDNTGLEVLHRTRDASLIALRRYNAASLNIDKHLPPFFKPYVLPDAPTSSVIPVPDDSVKRVQSLLSHLKYDDTIANIVQNISLPQMKNDITWLTGENEDSKILSRHSFSKGARIAASWISDRMEDTGAQCELRPFLTGFAPNIIW